MICCVTGHRPHGFPFSREDENILFLRYKEILSLEIDKLISYGCDHFITGMADGADIDFAELVLEKRDAGRDVILEAALPYPYFPRKKTTNASAKKENILISCDMLHTVSPYYYKGCMIRRNQYMVDKSDIVLAIWNGKENGGTWNTLKYAVSKGKIVKYIMLADIKINIDTFLIV